MNPYVLLAKLAVENYIKDYNPPTASEVPAESRRVVGGLESRLRRAPGKTIESPKDLPKEFSRKELAELFEKKSGTFVTITKDGELRGCVGTYLPTKINIAEEIIHNAVAAAIEDYRFNPIKKEELPYLSYTVYILSYPELVKDINELNPKKFGIIVKTTPFLYPTEASAEVEGEESKLPSSPLAVAREKKESSSTNEDVVFDGHVPFKSGLLLPDLKGVDTIEQQISIACQKGGINPGKEKIIIYRFTVKKYQ